MAYDAALRVDPAWLTGYFRIETNTRRGFWQLEYPKTLAVRVRESSRAAGAAKS